MIDDTFLHAHIQLSLIMGFTSIINNNGTENEVNLLLIYQLGHNLTILIV